MDYKLFDRVHVYLENFASKNCKQLELYKQRTAIYIIIHQ